MPKKNKTKRKISKKARKETFSTKLKNSFRESIDYTKESRNYIYFIVALFFLSGVIGFFNTENLTFLDEVIQGLGEQTLGMGPVELTGFIMQNNILASFSGMIFGIFFGIFPAFMALFNGLLVGYVYAIASEATSPLIIWMLIPHGIFELPAIFIALGIGVKLGTFMFTKEKNKFKELNRRIKKSFKVFFIIVLPLLIIAAIIEGLLIFFT